MTALLGLPLISRLTIVVMGLVAIAFGRSLQLDLDQARKRSRLRVGRRVR